MIDKVKVILRDGREVRLSDWQSLYGLAPYSNNIGKFFSIREYRFQKDIEDFGELVVNELLMRVLDGFREAVEEPVRLNSFNRNEEKQMKLKEQGFKTATYSPHVVKLAADIETKDEKQTREWVKVLKQVGDILQIKIRIGSEQYLKAGQTFIHVDVCPEYYSKGKPWSHFPHPAAWENKTTW
jgi:hypothetical protein